MKVIIPTNDGLTIAPDLNKATSLRCLTIINGSIKEDTLKPISADSNENRPFKIIAGLGLNRSDIWENHNPLYQQFVITTEFTKEIEKKLQKINFKLFTSPETNILNAIIIFLRNQKNQESDYCCGP
jgi:hypothetical protein